MQRCSNDNLAKYSELNYFLVTGSFNGGLSTMPAHDLGSIAIKEALERAKVKGAEVSEVILGQILTAGIVKE